MNFKNVFFRKMTVLYVIIIMIMGFELLVLSLDLNTTKSELNEDVTLYNSVVISSKKELKEIPEAKSYERVKITQNHYTYIKVDKTLTGNECIVPVKIGDIEIGKEMSLKNLYGSEGSFSCVVKGYSGAENPMNEVYVSQELYNSTPSETYDYIATPNSLKDMNKILRKYDMSYNNIVPYFMDYLDSMNHIIFEEAFIIGSVIIGLSLIVIIFMNTRGFVKNNTKKSRKKNKDNNNLKVIVASTIMTGALGLALAYALFVFIR